MNYRLQIPGKTFCCGEYAALVGGPAILVATKPGFEIRFIKKTVKTVNPFHHQSPAGAYFDQHASFFSNWTIEFQDHYNGRGGFGASTAQFLGLAYFKASQDASINQIQKRVWDDYQAVNKTLTPELGVSQLPSGYDLWAQMIGGVSLVKRLSMVPKSAFENQRTEWPFNDMDFIIVPTGFKVATHTHLGELNTDSLESLSATSQRVVDAWKVADSAQFIGTMNAWQQALGNLNLVHSKTIELVYSLSRHREILFAKGCGALGADILFIVFKRGAHNAIKTILSEMKLNEAYDCADLWNQDVRTQTW